MGKFARLGNELYSGHRSIDFIGNRRLWYSISAVLVLGALSVVYFKPLNLGIEFTGGSQVSVSLPADQVNQDTADTLREEVATAGIPAAGSPIVTTSGTSGIIIQTEALTQAESDQVAEVILGVVDVNADEDLNFTDIGATWGAEIAQRAILGVLVFLVLVVLFIWAYFRQWKMSLAALVALFHDIILTIGVYALSGFTVTPAAVTGLLAILGFSLYDTVVVFDKIKENTRSLRSSRTTYAAAANLAVNQTLVRSINTAIVALIPIGAILYVSSTQLGASSLQDLALAQFVGMGVGVYSSIFLAPRVLVQLKANESDVLLAEKRAKARARQADRYASVPSFTEDMPVPDERDDELLEDESFEEEGTRTGSTALPVAPPRAPEASDRGRVAPPARGPVQQSNASGRVQPVRETKSKRGKK